MKIFFDDKPDKLAFAVGDDVPGVTFLNVLNYDLLPGTERA
jgi:hypothetical protein